MSKKQEKSKFQWKALLLSFAITCGMLGLVIGLTIWYQNSIVTVVKWNWNTPEVWIGNAIAFLIMFLIIFLFIRKPKNSKYDHQEKW